MPFLTFFNRFFVASFCFASFVAVNAHAQTPGWFDPAPPKPAPAETKGTAPEVAPVEAEPEPEAPRQPEVGPAVRHPPPVARPAKPQVEWYGWQTLASDATSLALLGAAAASKENRTELAVASLGVYLLGAPIVHAANGRLGTGAISLGVRVGAPVTIGFWAAFSSLSCGNPTPGSSPNWLCEGGLIRLGLAAGVVGAMAADAVLLARKKVSPKPALSLTPTAMPTPRGVTFGLAGTF